MRSVLAILLLAGVASPALAQRDDQREAYQAMREGRIRPLGDILSRIPPGRRQSFIGSEFAPGDRYRLKFMERGEVQSVDVDARTGEVMDRRDPRALDRGVERRAFSDSAGDGERRDYRERRWGDRRGRRERF